MTWTVRLNWVPAVGSVATTSQYYVDRETGDGVFTEEQIVAATKSGPVGPFALAADVQYGASEITLLGVTGMTDSANTNAGIIEDAFVRWTSIDVGNKKLMGVTWYGGYGTYLSGSNLHWACETVLKSSSEASEPTEKTVWFRIRHSLSGKYSAPAFMPVFFPPAPASKDHCVVAIAVMQDLGIAGKYNVSPATPIKVYLEGDEFHRDGMLVERDGTPDVVSITDNTFQTGTSYSGASYIFAQCLKDSARVSLTGALKGYVVDISGESFTFSVPDMDFTTLLAVLTA